jgi:hypothetical protein
MAIKDSALPAASALSRADIVAVTQGGVTSKSTVGALADMVQAAPPNSQTGTTYTLVFSDQNKTVEMSNAAANVLTVPLNSAVPFEVGIAIPVAQMGAGRTSIAATGGVTIRTGSTLVLRGQYAVAWLIKRATDEWVLVGDLVGTKKEAFLIAASDLVTDITAATGKASFPMPYDFYVTEIFASLESALQSAGSIFTVDVNDDGSTLLSTKVTIDNGEYSSLTAATAAVVTSAPVLVAKGSKMSVDVDQVGTAGARGLVVALVGYPA